MVNAELDEIVKQIINIFGEHIECVSLSGKSYATGHENYYDLIFRNTTSYTARMFGYQYRKFLNELALLTNGEVKKTNSFSGFVYYWFPGFLFKKDNLKIEFGRKGWDKHRGDDSTTCFYMTTNNKYLIEEITNFILTKYKDMQSADEGYDLEHTWLNGEVLIIKVENGYASAWVQ